MQKKWSNWYYLPLAVVLLPFVAVAYGWLLETVSTRREPYPAWCQSLYPEIECQRVLDYRRAGR